MAPKHITASRSSLLSSFSSPSTSFSSELIEHSTTTFQKSPLYVVEEQEGYRTALEYVQLRLLRDKFTSFMFPPFLVSIAGAMMKAKSAHLGLYKARLNSDVVVLSTGGPSNSRGISAVRFVPGSQLSLLWRTPWTYATFGRAYGSAAESRKREVRVSDEVDDDDDGDAGEPSEFEDDDDVEDEQRIEDSDDDEEEEDQEHQSQGPAKKKLGTKPPKPKLSDGQGRVLNERITARILRLVDDVGKSHRIISRDEALTLAKRQQLDLVLVDGRSDPPVCKIYDFQKEEYKQEQILKERKKKKGAMLHLNEVKELRFTFKTEPKDLKMKVEKAKEFMDRGYKVKFVAIFKSKIEDEKKRLEEEKMIDAIFPMMEDVAAIEQGPRVESRQAWMMLKHARFSKKKPPKQAKIGATDQVESVKHEDQVFSEPDSYQGQEQDAMYAQNASSVSEAVPMGRLQGYPTEPFVYRRPSEAGHSRVQPPPLQDTFKGSSSKVQSSPLHGFPQMQPSAVPSATTTPPSILQGSHPDPSPSVPAQNVQERYSPPLQRSEGLLPQGVPRYPPPPLQGFEGFPPRGVPRPPIGQPRYPPPLGQPSFLGSQTPQGEYPPGNQNQQLQGRMQGSDGSSFMHQMRSQPRPVLDFAAPDISQQQNYGHEQGQDRYAPPPNTFGSSQRPQQGPPNTFGSSQRPQQGPSNLFGAPQRPPQGQSNLFGSPQRPQQGPPNLFGSPLRPQQGPSNLFGSQPHQQQGPPEQSQIQFGYQPVGVPQGPQQGPWLSQQAPPRYPSPIPAHPQQTGQQPSQGHQGYFGQQEAQGGGQNYWQSQASQGYPSQQHQGLKGYPSQQNQAPQGYPPQQNQAPQGYPPQQNQAPQGYPPQQNQAHQGYPPQRGFPQTRLAQGAFGFQGNYPQNQASQGSPPPRGGLPPTRPVVPSPPGFRPSWSTPQSQEYSPLFEPPSDKP